MPCPQDYPLSGDMTAATAFYNTEAEAKAAFSTLAQNVAKQLAKAYARCPKSCECWKLKPIGYVIVFNEQMSVQCVPRFGCLASGSFEWKTTITCEGSANPEIDRFIQQFCKAAKKHARHQWTVATAYWNDLWCGLTLGLIGDGCTAWSEWVRSWFWSSEWHGEGVKITHVELPFPWTHKIELITFPDGTRLVLDPWRDPDNPIWDADEYELRYGPWILFD